MSERIVYGDHFVHIDPAETVHRGEDEPSHGYCVNLRKVLKKFANNCLCFEHTAALMGNNVHPVARSESESENMIFVARSSRS